MAPSLFAQSSSTAVMEVRVEVIHGSGVSYNNSEEINLVQNTQNSLGTLNLSGVNEGDVILSVDPKLNLQNEFGDHIQLDISSIWEEAQKNGTKVSLTGNAKNELKSGRYTGHLKTTIQYL